MVSGMKGVNDGIGMIRRVGGHRLPEAALVESEDSERAGYNFNRRRLACFSSECDTDRGIANRDRGR
jgi:hypothetical protein